MYIKHYHIYYLHSTCPFLNSWISIVTGIISMMLLLPCVFKEFNVVDKEHGHFTRVKSGKMTYEIYCLHPLNYCFFSYKKLVLARKNIFKNDFHANLDDTKTNVSDANRDAVSAYHPDMFAASVCIVMFFLYFATFTAVET